MESGKFKLCSRLASIAVFVAAAVTYLSTIEPSASYWDCGEFIASSYKLEVGHPPGNPVFQLIARFFTMFGDNMHAAVLVNAMSALCSALTIFFLYLTIVFFAKRMFRSKEDGSYDTGDAIAVIGSGIVGSLAYCFSDTFWFSAVEGEVYAMSSLFTATVFWAMTRWYEVADEPHANRWIVLISFLMGLSIGVHLLNLLAIPALVFMFYYRKKEDGAYSLKQCLGIMGISVVILGLILFFIIPYLPKFAAYSDLFFVNVLGLPYNSGAAFFVAAVLALCFWGLFVTLRKGKVFWNTVLMCLTTIIIGFSLFSICVIRSSVKTPTNEYQPDNAFTLVRYLSREQYGKTPLIYGQYYDAPYDIKSGSYWAPVDGKYRKCASPMDAEYKSEGKMLFPRMWSSSPNGRYESFYDEYTRGEGKVIPGQEHRKPSFGANMRYFFDYQVNWMYWRYFMWNFAGRQNDIHSPAPGNIFHGNWECGIPFVDNARLGDQSDAPAILRENKGKNHYFLLPLLLGLLGLFFQFSKDKRGCWLVFLMFFMTGLAIVLYLNQPPYQVRERDYAYAGSFYAFSIWIGFAVAAVFEWLRMAFKGRGEVPLSAAVSAACLCVPVLMAEQNWDDHDRSNRYTAVAMARNYLNSVGKNGILVTHGDNDTFPLWYAQEVENVRTDVRICNTSLLGTDWHIDQMTWACNESAPLPISVDHKQYLYGTNEYIYIVDTRDAVIPLKDVMAVFKHPQAKAMAGNQKVDYICSRKFSIPVNKENVLKYGIVPEKFADLIQDTIVLEIPAGKNFLSKPELFMMDLLSGYEWDRPINVLSNGGDLDMGLKSYLMSDGYSQRFVPIRNTCTATDYGLADAEHLHELLTRDFDFSAFARDDYFVDYQNLYTHLGVMPLRTMFATCAELFLNEGHADWAAETMDLSINTLSPGRYPLDGVPVDLAGNDYTVAMMVDMYYRLSLPDKARSLGEQFVSELLTSVNFYLEFYSISQENFKMVSQYINYVADIANSHGDKDFAGKISTVLSNLVKMYQSSES